MYLVYEGQKVNVSSAMSAIKVLRDHAKQKLHTALKLTNIDAFAEGADCIDTADFMTILLVKHLKAKLKNSTIQDEAMGLVYTINSLERGISDSKQGTYDS